VVVGTLYKQMQLKPSILEEYSKEVGFLLIPSWFFLLSKCFHAQVFFVVSMHSWSGFSHQNAFLMFCLSGILQNVSNEIDFFLYLYTNDSDVGCSLCGKKCIWLH
jgi:hypothetical protein